MRPLAKCLALLMLIACHGLTTALAQQSVCPSRGLEIPAELPYFRYGDIPGYERFGGEVLRRAPDDSFYGVQFLKKGRTKCLVLHLVRPDRSRIIEDAIDITRYYHHPGARWMEFTKCYPLRASWRIDREADTLILGFTLPEKELRDCAHYSKRVLSAWRVDFEAGRFVTISTGGLICDLAESGDGCYQCDRYKDGLHCK